MGKKVIQKAGKYFTEEQNYTGVKFDPKRQNGDMEELTGNEVPMVSFFAGCDSRSYKTGIRTRRTNIVSNIYSMTQKKVKPDKVVNTSDESFENLQVFKLLN